MRVPRDVPANLRRRRADDNRRADGFRRRLLCGSHVQSTAFARIALWQNAGALRAISEKPLIKIRFAPMRFLPEQVGFRAPLFF